MKKFLFLMLSAAVAVSASAGITKAAMQKNIGVVNTNISKGEMLTRGHGSITHAVPMQFNGWDKFVSRVTRSDQAITWDFEDEACFNEFQALDNDGDGYNWYYHNNEGLTQGLMTAHGGNGLVCSASYDNDTQTALTPDNWLISPEVTLGGALKFWAMGQDASYCSEVFGVYVCVGTPDGTTNFVQVGSDFTATGAYVEYEIDLSAYQGQVGHFAIVHHNVTDQFILNIDDITLDASAVALPYPIVPVVNVTPAATTAAVAWGADDAAEGWKLRWRPYTEPTGKMYDFASANISEQLEDWYSYNADGDTLDWSLYYTDATHTDLIWISESYTSDGGFAPDNWLISPEVDLKGVVSFTLGGSATYSDQYPDHLGVFLLQGWDPSAGAAPEETNLVLLEEFDNSTTPTDYSVDLSAYDGQKGRIVFRHYNCEDMMYLSLDNIYIGEPYTPAEWTYVDGLTTNNYTIEGLTPETTYEVQVMGYNASHESDWCDIVTFVTLAEQAGILGDVNKDGFVKIDDVTALLDALLSGNVMDETANYSPDNADVNQDGEVKIDDVTALIDMLLAM